MTQACIHFSVSILAAQLKANRFSIVRWYVITECIFTVRRVRVIVDVIKRGVCVCGDKVGYIEMLKDMNKHSACDFKCTKAET